VLVFPLSCGGRLNLKRPLGIVSLPTTSQYLISLYILGCNAV
jgi:hypothetical protein